MSGETEQNISAWTVDSLHTLVEESNSERERRNDQRFASQEKAIALAAEKAENDLANIRACYDTLLAERDIRSREMFEEREKWVNAAVANLRTYYDAMLAERNTQYVARLEGMDEKREVAFSTLEKEFTERVQQVRAETIIAMAAAEKAISKAETATEKRFESVNEFRAQQADIIQTFARKTEIDTRLVGLTEKVEAYQTQAAGSAASAMPRAEYDRAHTDLTERVLQLEKQINEKMEVQAKTYEQRLNQLQAQISAIEAVTR